jgi:hypothetical protein
MFGGRRTVFSTPVRAPSEHHSKAAPPPAATAPADGAELPLQKRRLEDAVGLAAAAPHAQLGGDAVVALTPADQVLHPDGVAAPGHPAKVAVAPASPSRSPSVAAQQRPVTSVAATLAAVAASARWKLAAALAPAAALHLPMASANVTPLVMIVACPALPAAATTQAVAARNAVAHRAATLLVRGLEAAVAGGAPLAAAAHVVSAVGTPCADRRRGEIETLLAQRDDGAIGSPPAVVVIAGSRGGPVARVVVAVDGADVRVGADVPAVVRFTMAEMEAL